MEFDLPELKSAMEKALGFEFSKFEKLPCLNSINIEAVRKGDGFRFLIKLIAGYWPGSYERLVAHLADMKGELTISRLFEKEAPAKFGDWFVVCTTWCEGTKKTPDQLTEEEFKGFLADYLRFSKAMQSATLVEPVYKVREWREAAIARCHGLLGRIFKRYVDEAPAEHSYYEVDKCKVTHGDLHPGNFRFVGGRVSGFLDIEGFVLAYPTWDILRYIVYSVMHLKFWEFGRKRRCLDRFAQAVDTMPYSREEWLVAINADWIEQIDKKVRDRDPKWIDIPHLWIRARLYRKLRRMI